VWLSKVLFSVNRILLLILLPFVVCGPFAVNTNSHLRDFVTLQFVPGYGFFDVYRLRFLGNDFAKSYSGAVVN